MNGKQKLTAMLLMLSLCASGWTSALGSAPASQFGFSGWPYRQRTGCTTPEPSAHPTASPRPAFTCTPTATPIPTAEPTPKATAQPTATPTAAPTAAPTTTPAIVPTVTPTAQPTATPSPSPSPAPTKAPQATQKPANTAIPPTSSDDYTTPSITAQEENAFLLLNQDRSSNGLSALTLDPALCEIARLKSRDMHENSYFAHTSPTYGSASDMLKAFGYSFTSVGENIAHHATVEKAQAAFMSSSGHRRNILGSQWSKVGIGVWTDSQGFVYVTQLFVR